MAELSDDNRLDLVVGGRVVLRNNGDGSVRDPLERKADLVGVFNGSVAVFMNDAR